MLVSGRVNILTFKSLLFFFDSSTKNKSIVDHFLNLFSSRKCQLTEYQLFEAKTSRATSPTKNQLFKKKYQLQLPTSPNPYRSLTASLPLKSDRAPIGKDRLPTTDFFRGYVKLQGGTTKTSQKIKITSKITNHFSPLLWLVKRRALAKHQNFNWILKGFYPPWN